MAINERIKTHEQTHDENKVKKLKNKKIEWRTKYKNTEAFTWIKVDFSFDLLIINWIKEII